MIRREVCQYDGTVLHNGAPCPKCEESIQEHLRTCWVCSADYADLRERDARSGE